MKQDPSRSYVSIDDNTRALLAALPDSALIFDRGGRILAANQSAEKTFAEEAPSLEGQNIFDIIRTHVSEERLIQIEKAVYSGRDASFQDEINGRLYLHNFRPILNPWGDIARVALTSRDITELRKSDENLRREQQRHIFFMETFPGLVFHIYPDGAIRYANRYFRKTIGSPSSQQCTELLNCDGKLCSACPPKTAMTMDKTVEWEWTLENGRTFHIQCSPMTDSSGERMVMALGIDITERKKAEDELRHAHSELEDRVKQRTLELEKANKQLTQKSRKLVRAKRNADLATRAKSSFLANMSHEIRTPLNAILGMSELAAQTEDTQTRNGYLANVLEAGNALLAVINDVLDFSKIEARKLELESIPFSIREVVESVVSIHSLQASRQNLKLTLEVQEDVPEVVMGDPSRLRQILINLTGNAIKFTAKGGINITVKATATSPKDNEALTSVEFSVQDTGVGIPRAKLDKIFESFHQVDESVTRKHGGTGLGLTICKELVTLMGGTISATSKENQGSTFTFTIPLETASSQVAQPCIEDVDPALLPRNLNILLVDDNTLNRRLATAILQDHGHDVTRAENGREAIELLKAGKFDMVFMDVQMPIMDGVTATRIIRDPDSGVLDPDIPIVALTAHALQGDRERFLKAGMNAYLPKPMSINKLLGTMQSVLTGRPLQCERNGISAETGDLRSPFDREKALAMLGGQKDLLRTMDAMFLEQAPEDFRKLQMRVRRKHYKAAQNLAHSIKGAARTIGAMRAGMVAEELEYLCGKKDHTAIADQTKKLETELANTYELISEDQNNRETA